MGKRLDTVVLQLHAVKRKKEFSDGEGHRRRADIKTLAGVFPPSCPSLGAPALLTFLVSHSLSPPWGTLPGWDYRPTYWQFPVLASDSFTVEWGLPHRVMSWSKDSTYVSRGMGGQDDLGGYSFLLEDKLYNSSTGEAGACRSL